MRKLDKLTCTHRVNPTKGTPFSRSRKLLQRAGIVRARDLELVGVSRTELEKFVERGVIECWAPGIYALPGWGQCERAELALAAVRMPAGVICLLSALRFHGLTGQNPSEVWMSIEKKVWGPEVAHPPLRFMVRSGAGQTEGVEEHDGWGATLRVFSAAKTVADCFKFRSKIGIDVAVEALQDYRDLHPKRLEAVRRFAKINRVSQVIRPYLESLE